MNLAKHKKERLELLINKAERIDYQSEPWPIPKAGDVVRALVRFDVDPGKTVYSGADSLRHARVDCRVRTVEPGCAGGCTFIYFDPLEPLPKPEQISDWAGSGKSGQDWSGVDVVNHGGWPDEYIPIEAIKRLAFLAAVEEMKDHLDRSAAWR